MPVPTISTTAHSSAALIHRLYTLSNLPPCIEGEVTLPTIPCLLQFEQTTHEGEAAAAAAGRGGVLFRGERSAVQCVPAIWSTEHGADEQTTIKSGMQQQPPDAGILISQKQGQDHLLGTFLP